MSHIVTLSIGNNQATGETGGADDHDASVVEESQPQ